MIAPDEFAEIIERMITCGEHWKFLCQLNFI